MRVRYAAAAAFVLILAAGPRPVFGQEDVTPEEIRAAIDQLGSLDYPVRMNASRTVRRAASPLAVPALIGAVSEHPDGYVRFRALVLLSGFNDPRARDVMEAALDDPNDRLRTVAYSYFEHHPEAAMAPVLLSALDREVSEFVRPALVRALAAHGGDAKVRETLLVEVNRGQDFFRSTVIEALGDYRAGYAVAALVAIAEREGPLQVDAVQALGKIGDRRAMPTLASLQRTAPRRVQPSLAAAICLLGTNCTAHRRFLTDTLTFAAGNPGFQDLARAAAAGLGALAASGDAAALTTLFEVGIPSRDPARAPIALAIGLVALRNTPLVLGTLEPYGDAGGAIELIGEAFEMLDEDYEEERFFVTTRRSYWQADEGSATRRTGDALIQRLEF